MNTEQPGGPEHTPEPIPEPAPATDPGPLGGERTTETSSDDRTMASVAHLLGFFTSFVGPLIIWLIKKDTSPYVNDQGKEALNFQITLLLAQIIAGALTVVVIGCVMLPAIYIFDLVFCILATVAASRGELYRYPLCLRLVQ